MSDPKVNAESAGTVRVRIAVAVDAFGLYGADTHDHAEAAKWLNGPAAHVWIEADVPLPLAPQVVEGTVTPASEDT